MVLLAITMAASYIPYHAHPALSDLAIVVALAIALTKAALVVLYFMHVKLASPLTRLFVIAGILWLAIMVSLTYSDYLTRGWLPTGRGWSAHPVVPAP
jgi:cytochrome c oxidase subunit 4